VEGPRGQRWKDAKDYKNGPNNYVVYNTHKHTHPSTVASSEEGRNMRWSETQHTHDNRVWSEKKRA